jgi:hypothetical protein
MKLLRARNQSFFTGTSHQGTHAGTSSNRFKFHCCTAAELTAAVVNKTRSAGVVVNLVAIIRRRCGQHPPYIVARVLDAAFVVLVVVSVVASIRIIRSSFFFGVSRAGAFSPGNPACDTCSGYMTAHITHATQRQETCIATEQNHEQRQGYNHPSLKHGDNEPAST